MGRPAKFDREVLLDAAAELAAEGGVSAVTIAALAERSGAPTGSIYHRFDGLETLLAELWLRTVERFQGGAIAALDAACDGRGAVEVALYTPRWARAHLGEARLLLLHRRSEVAKRWPERLGPRAEMLGAEGRRALESFACRLWGRASRRTLRAARYLVIDAPYAAVRPYLLEGVVPPPIVDELLALTCEGVIASFVAEPCEAEEAPGRSSEAAEAPGRSSEAEEAPGRS